METGRPKKSVNTHAGRGDDRHFFVAEEDHVAGVTENRGHIRRDEELSVAEADDDRRAVADGHDFSRIVGRDEHQREEPAHQQQGPPHRVLQAVVLHLALDQVRDDLGVGLGDERVTLLLELLLQIEVVLDDAVVHDHDLSGAVPVRVGVLLGGPSVRGPSGVSDAVAAGQGMQRDHVFEARQFSRAPAQLDVAVIRRRRRPPSRSRGIPSAAVRR